MSEQTQDQQAYFEEHRAELDSLIENCPDDALFFSRFFKRGPDPWAIIQVYPEICEDLADLLCLEADQIKDATVKAHFAGPAVLIGDGGGIGPHLSDQITEWDEEHQLEAAWLFLAAHSHCAEEGYDPNLSLIDRQRHLVKSAVRANRTLETAGFTARMARAYLDQLLADFEFEPLEGGVLSKCLRGTPDRGFYAAYKAGHSVVAVDSGPLRFWGTDTTTTLQEAGIKVDKEKSPFFGIIFSKES